MFWHSSVLPSHPSICLSTGGGYPYPIMLCNISQNAMGQPLGGYPARSSRGGTLVGGTLLRVPCGEVPRSGTPPGQDRGGTLPGGTQVRYPPSAKFPPRQGQEGGGTQLGQHREYLLHGGRYASCVHAGGLSCLQLNVDNALYKRNTSTCCCKNVWEKLLQRNIWTARLV